MPYTRFFNMELIGELKQLREQASIQMDSGRLTELTWRILVLLDQQEEKQKALILRKP